MCLLFSSFLELASRIGAVGAIAGTDCQYNCKFEIIFGTVTPGGSFVISVDKGFASATPNVFFNKKLPISKVFEDIYYLTNNKFITLFTP